MARLSDISLLPPIRLARYPRARSIDYINDAYFDVISLTSSNLVFCCRGNTEVARSLFTNCPCIQTPLKLTSCLQILCVMTKAISVTLDLETKFIFLCKWMIPLWDGAGCGANSTCCSFNNPSWFLKEFGDSLTDDIEMRVCRNQVRSVVIRNYTH